METNFTTEHNQRKLLEISCEELQNGDIFAQNSSLDASCSPG